MKPWKKKLYLENGREEDDQPEGYIHVSMTEDKFKQIQQELGKTLLPKPGAYSLVDLEDHIDIEPEVTYFRRDMVKKGPGNYEEETTEVKRPYHKANLYTTSGTSTYTGNETVALSIQPSESCTSKAYLDDLNVVTLFELDEYFNEKVRQEVVLKFPVDVSGESDHDKKIIALFRGHENRQIPIYVWDKENFPGVKEIDWNTYKYAYGNAAKPRLFKDEWTIATGWIELKSEIYSAYFNAQGGTLLTASKIPNKGREIKGMQVETFAEIKDPDLLRRINNHFGTVFEKKDFKDEVYYRITVEGKDMNQTRLNALQARNKKREYEQIGFKDVKIEPLITSALGNEDLNFSSLATNRP